MLVSLWSWVIEYYPTGILEGVSSDEIKEACLWDGDADELLQALEDIGFVNENEEGLLSINDWEEYGGKIIRGRVKNAERQRSHRAKQDTKKRHNCDITVTSQKNNGTDKTRVRQENNREEERTKENDISATLQQSEAVALLIFPCNGKIKSWNLTQEKIAEWQECFPGFPVLNECRKALQWVTDNPGRRKTTRGMPRFLFSWLERANNSGRNQTLFNPGESPPESFSEKHNRGEF